MGATIALVDYGAGNVRSAQRALEAAAANAELEITVTLTAEPERIRSADRVVLPGQGAFSQCVTALRAAGVEEALREAVLTRGAPFLGICVGAQLLMSEGLEHGSYAGLDWIGGVCRRLETTERLPHMGWNEAAPQRHHPVLAGLAPRRHMYFAHSYVVAPTEPADILATTGYGEVFPAAIARANMVGVQFHPEKSQAAGLDLLARFLQWTP